MVNNNTLDQNNTVDDCHEFIFRNIESDTIFPWCSQQLSRKINLLRDEFVGLPEICLYQVFLIINIRRNIQTRKNWRKFQQTWTKHYKELIAHLNSRWLISALDTFADYGTPIQRSNALLCSSFFNFLKLSETERIIMRDHRIHASMLGMGLRPLWDGMETFVMTKGDTLVNLLNRSFSILSVTPMLKDIFIALLKRAVNNDTLLGRISEVNERFKTFLRKNDLNK